MQKGLFGTDAGVIPVQEPEARPLTFRHDESAFDLLPVVSSWVVHHRITHLCEPFAGSGALSFALLQEHLIDHAFLGDRNKTYAGIFGSIVLHSHDLAHALHVIAEHPAVAGRPADEGFPPRWRSLHLPGTSDMEWYVVRSAYALCELEASGRLLTTFSSGDGASPPPPLSRPLDGSCKRVFVRLRNYVQACKGTAQCTSDDGLHLLRDIISGMRVDTSSTRWGLLLVPPFDASLVHYRCGSGRESVDLAGLAEILSSTSLPYLILSPPSRALERLMGQLGLDPVLHQTIRHSKDFWAIAPDSTAFM